MQKFVAVLFLLLMTGNAIHARCINKIHQKVKKTLVAGKNIEINNYSCSVKALETENFDSNGACKNCGCSISDHDNIQG